MRIPPDKLSQMFPQPVSQQQKEKLLGQRGKVFWLTGLSGAGKSTLAQLAERELHAAGRLSKVLDGDQVRRHINAHLGFSLEDRRENIRRVAEIAKLFCETGVIAICSFISPTEAIRGMAREIIGPDHYREIYLSASLATCEARDPKGLYQKARAGLIDNFTGIDSPYEVPDSPDLSIATDSLSIEESGEMLLEFIRRETVSG